MADLLDPDAVTRLLQAKRRTRHAPSLVFLDRAERLAEVAATVPDEAARLAAAFWPGRLTILLEPGEDVPRAVARQVARANRRIGVRVPADPMVRRILEAFGGSVLVSSANRERKGGAQSVVQVKKSFQGRLDVLVDAGDLTMGPRSTVVEVDAGAVRITRPGDLGAADLEAALGPGAQVLGG